MATRLPSTSGDDPVGEPYGCDTSDLIQIHRIFRWLYRELPILIREVEPGDSARSAIVGDYAKLDVLALHLHHHGEDIVLWDRLAARAPACAAHVDRMRAQHAAVATQLDDIEPLIASWRDSADPALAEQLAARADGIRDTLFAHLDEEEEQIMPLAAEWLTESEWGELETHARESLQRNRHDYPRDPMALQFGLLLATVPEAERQAYFKDNFPLIARLMYLLLMKRKYDRAMAELYPDRPAPPID